MLINSSHESIEPTAMLSRRARRARSQSLIADLAIGSVALAVLLCIALLAPAPWTARVGNGLRSDATCQTQSLAERVPCLERPNDAVSAQPAKGANAPLGVGTAGNAAQFSTGSIPQD
jgi:hypothetical protein